MCVYVLLNIWYSAITRISDARRMIEISAKCVWLKSGLAANFHNGINVRITRSYFCNTQTVVCNHESVTWIIPKMSKIEILSIRRLAQKTFILWIILLIKLEFMLNPLSHTFSFVCNSFCKLLVSG